MRRWRRFVRCCGRPWRARVLGLGWATVAGPGLAAQEVRLELGSELREFRIAPHASESASPRMPALPLRLVDGAGMVAGEVQWTASTAYATRERNPLQLTDRFEGQAAGGAWPQDLFRQPPAPGAAHGRAVVRGGALRIAARLAASGAEATALDDLRLRLGDQPDRVRVVQRLAMADAVLPDGTRVDGALLSAWIRAIAWHESRQRQNAVADDPAHFQALGEPLMNRSGDGGIGIMQRTPRGTERLPGRSQVQDWLWDWSANVDEGKRLFLDDKLRAMAYRFPAEVARCAAFARACAATHQHRRSLGLEPLRRIRVPAFTAEQLLLDAVRGYNGYAGRDPLGRALHEFRLRTRSTASGLALEVADPGPDPEAPDQAMAWAVWEPVPAADRPARVGDPDYVEHVRAHLPVSGAT